MGEPGMTLRPKQWSILQAACIAGSLMFAAPAFAQEPRTSDIAAGKSVYDRACASCHDNPGTTRAAGLAALRATSPAQLRSVMTEGVMKPMAASLSAADMTQLIAWLTADQKQSAAHWTEALMCAADNRKVNAAAPVAMNGFGAGANSARALTAAQAGLKTPDMASLEVAWAIGVPQTPSMGTGVAVIGDTGFINAGGSLLALDVQKGCARWVYSGGMSRNTPAVADVNGRRVLAFATVRGEVHMLDAASGALIWKADGKPKNGVGSVRGGVVIHGDKVIVPISASGVAAGQNPKYECCEGHGAVVALSTRDGSRVWEYHTMKDAEYNGEVNSAGTKLKGPSGAPIWSVPLIDAKRNRVIVTTGENTSHPATDTSDAVIAIDLDTGRRVWNFQAMSDDVWNMACDPVTPSEAQGGVAAANRKDGPNCPYLSKGAGRDFDFGAGAVLVPDIDGRDMILAGQKSGDVWALDAATGEVLWNQKIGVGTALGGVHWGIASDGKRVFAPINDTERLLSPAGLEAKPGVYAFDVKTGAPIWSHPATKDCTSERGKLISNCEVQYGFSAAPLLIDGALVAAQLTGRVTIFNAATGAVLKEIETVGPIDTINGVPGKGGAIDSHAVSAGGGMLFIGSGYGAFDQTAGNVLIALKPSR